MVGLDPTIHAFFLLQYRPTKKTWMAVPFFAGMTAAMTGRLAETAFTR